MGYYCCQCLEISNTCWYFLSERVQKYWMYFALARVTPIFYHRTYLHLTIFHLFGKDLCISVANFGHSKCIGIFILLNDI